MKNMTSPYEPENPWQVIRTAEMLGVGVTRNNGALTLALPKGVSREMAHTVAGRLRARGYISQRQYHVALWFREKFHKAFGDTEPLTPERDKAMGKKKYYPDEIPGDFDAMRELGKIESALKKRGRTYRIILRYMDADPIWINGVRGEAQMRELGILKRTLDDMADIIRI